MKRKTRRVPICPSSQRRHKTADVRNPVGVRKLMSSFSINESAVVALVIPWRIVNNITGRQNSQTGMRIRNQEMVIISSNLSIARNQKEPTMRFGVMIVDRRPQSMHERSASNLTPDLNWYLLPF